MACVMRVLALTGTIEFDDGENPAGLYVVHCDVDAYGGRGFVELHADPAQARAFISSTEAMHYWRRISHVRPLRSDGQPNRPLTAYTIEVVDV